MLNVGGFKSTDVFKSTDGGASWTAAAVNTGVTATPVEALAIDPVTPTTVYAGTDDSVFKSTDAGGSWTVAGLTSLAVHALAIDPVTATTVYAGTAAGGVFKSTDAGASWTPVNTGLRDESIFALAIDPVTGTTVYVGTGGGGVFEFESVPTTTTTVPSTTTTTTAPPAAREYLNNLTALVRGFGLGSGTTTSLTAKLDAASTALQDGQRQDACGALTAFVNQARTRAGKKLTKAQADRLIAEATQISLALSCK